MRKTFEKEMANLEKMFRGHVWIGGGTVADSVGQIGLDLVVNQNQFKQQMAGIQGWPKRLVPPWRRHLR